MAKREEDFVWQLNSAVDLPFFFALALNNLSEMNVVLLAFFIPQRSVSSVSLRRLLFGGHQRKLNLALLQDMTESDEMR